METKANKAAGNLAEWLEGRLRVEHLSTRQAAIRTGLSHATIADIRKGGRPYPVTIQKLIRVFGGGGPNELLALEDHLLTQAGYRTPRPEGKKPNMALAQLIDKVSGFSEPRLEMMLNFADFLLEIESKR